MKKLLCESIVYCDFLLILLLIVGVLINNKAFVCLFVCLLKYTPLYYCNLLKQIYVQAYKQVPLREGHLRCTLL